MKMLNSIFLVCCLASLVTLDSCSENEKNKLLIQIIPAGLKEGLPAVTTTVNPESITATRVVVEGNVTSEGSGPVFRSGFEVSVSPYYEMARMNYCSSGKGKFTYEITGLWPGRTYHVRAYAKNSLGTAYGNDVGFSTPEPMVTTDAVKEVSQTSATVVGSVKMINFSDIYEGGVCYGTSPAPTIEGFKIVSNDAFGIYDCKLQNLIPGTQYYVRAYVSGRWSEAWSWGTLPSFYGNEIKFTTEVADHVP